LYVIATMILNLLAAIAAALVLGFGFVLLIFLGDAHARGEHLLSRRVDWLAALVVYLSWFGLMLWFGYSQLLLMLGCGAAVLLAVVYTASLRATERQARQPDLAASPAPSSTPLRS
jgi:hypothetical protein